MRWCVDRTLVYVHVYVQECMVMSVMCMWYVICDM
jgi:hypothetical protein